ncbi:baseplate megatron protein TIM-barrel domain-containing protein [Beijerinckia indica]|uniref:GTA TIM-barrel-like domain-containing protein n=1 Tax=Beijerinckia indica subsp. indica (strain ATCC 9039 / DSM 1715 / NCIMB 8712) TaxID=395963 RepID=B2IJD8_BEII9|nr:glycoside hydrolase TIM-barrel-like domain-containing protein [Beijerinckia indica]ACB96300.1 conserved hypothetical protein [Beijerinckia indica subsp. indica ATCC 9039]
MGRQNYVNGVHLLPATGEFSYDTLPRFGQRIDEAGFSPLNLFHGGIPGKTDFSTSIDQLQAAFPECTTVSLIVAWFGSSVDAASCRIYPSTTYIGGAFQDESGHADAWYCSGLTQISNGLIPLPRSGSSFVYGGTPSDPSIVRAIRDLKARGLRVVFYPFILMTSAGFPWRGRITFAADRSEEATTAVTTFLGSATVDQFTPDTDNLTVGYSGAPADYSFRRMILHYASLCASAGGVDLFLIGSELRGLEQIRGPHWSTAGTVDGNGCAVWDYPFVDGLMALASDVRAIFDSAGLMRDRAGLHNLITYSADWSVWMGVQHADSNGQWPHLDRLYDHDAIDLVAFDNYLPLSDWTSGTGGLDLLHWSDPRGQTWPPSADEMNALGLSGTPMLKSKAYLKANIEGGEKYHWFYYDSDNLGRGLDPNGTGAQVSRPAGDRLTQTRHPYFADQHLLANKHLRWWWNNPHQAVYDAGDGAGFVPHGPRTQWGEQSKSIIFTEYGFPTCDRGTNQPNVFYDPKSSESFTPYWSIWESMDGAAYRPVQDDELVLLALQAIHEYWFEEGNNETSPNGLTMIEPTFCSIWSWDARPFPVFPNRADLWGDASNWRAGNWLNGKGPFLMPPVLDEPPISGSFPVFPTLKGQGWSIHYQPLFDTLATLHASGRESRAARRANAQFEIDLTFDHLGMEAEADFQTLAGFYLSMQGTHGLFTFPMPDEWGLGPSLLCRFADDVQDFEEFMMRFWTVQSLKLQTVRP